MSAPSFSVALDPIGGTVVHARVSVEREGSRAYLGTLVASPEDAAAIAVRLTGPAFVAHVGAEAAERALSKETA